MPGSRSELIAAELERLKRRADATRLYVSKLDALSTLLLVVALGQVEESELEVPIARARAAVEHARMAIEELPEATDGLPNG